MDEQRSPLGITDLDRTFQWPRALRSLRFRDFRIYLTSQSVSQLGIWMQIVAQGWLVYNLTDSPFMLGLVNFAALLPVLPISLLAGVLSDRYPRKNIIIITEIVLMLQAFILAGLIWFNQIQVWHLILLGFVLGAAGAFEQPFRQGFILDLVGKDELSNAVALYSSGNNGARILGPTIAGLVIATSGEAMCFFINAFTYLFVAISLFMIRQSEKPSAVKDLKIIGSVKDGFRYIFQNKQISGLLLIISVASFLTLPYIALMPVFARDSLGVGAVGLGYLLTAVGVGAILGALIIACVLPGKRGQWLVLANLIGPVFLVFFCTSRFFYLSLLFVVLAGLSNTTRLTLATSLIQINTTSEYHGRVVSIFNILFNGMSRIGALVIGGLAEFVGAAWALGVAAGISGLIGVIIIFRMPQIRQLA